MFRSPLLCVLLGAAAAAQTEAQRALPEGPRLLVREDLVPVATLQVAGKLGLQGHVPGAVWLGDNTSAVANVTVDTAALEVLEVTAERVQLRRFAGPELWSVARMTAPADVDAGAARRLFSGDRVCMPRAGGGLIALDRRTGAVVWQRPEAPNQLLLADGALVAAGGSVDGKPVLAVYAAANGAPACRVTLPAAPQRLVAGRQGIAVAHAGGVVAFDRTGPQLFALPKPVSALVAGPDGWFAATTGKVESWTHAGKVRWQVDKETPRHESLLLAATDDGCVVAVTFMPHADSGCDAVCLAAADGAMVWRYQGPALGVDHSKYWHQLLARTCGDELLLVSQAAGGNFVVALDARTGVPRAREVIGK